MSITHRVLHCIIVLAASLPLASRAADETEKDFRDLSGRAGKYISFSGAWTEPAGDFEIPGATINGIQAFPQTSISLRSGYAGMVAFGMYQGNLRGEAEFSYRDNDISHITSTPPITSSSGNVAAFSIMANGYGDLALTRRISAYLGGGFGLAFLDFNAHATQTGGGSYDIDSSSTAFALQGMIGLNFKVTQRLTVTGGFRAWTALGVDAAFVSTGAGTIVHAQSNNHFDLPVMYGPEVGLRLDF